MPSRGESPDVKVVDVFYSFDAEYVLFHVLQPKMAWHGLQKDRCRLCHELPRAHKDNCSDNQAQHGVCNPEVEEQYQECSSDDPYRGEEVAKHVQEGPSDIQVGARPIVKDEYPCAIHNKSGDCDG